MRESRKWAALAFILTTALGATKAKKPDEFLHYFLVPLPPDPYAHEKLLKEAKILLKQHEARHARRRRVR